MKGRYLEGQGDLVRTLVTLISHAVTPVKHGVQNVEAFCIWRFPKIEGTFRGGVPMVRNIEYSIAGSIFSSFCSGKLPSEAGRQEENQLENSMGNEMNRNWIPV